MNVERVCTEGRQAMRDLLGAHISIAGGLARALVRGVDNDCGVVQIFTSSNMAWHTREPDEREVGRFRQTWAETGIRRVVSHGSYLVNLCSADGETARRSVDALTAELTRCERLGVDRLVMHPGAHMGRGVDEGLKAVAAGIDEAMERSRTEHVRILLETPGGAGTVLGGRFEELAEIIERSRWGKRLGVCLDTAHLFVAGYDLRTAAGWSRVMKELERTVGAKRVGCVHLNDCKGDLGSRLDRHEQIGRGTLGLEAFAQVLNDKRLADVPMVLETPKGTYRGQSWDRINLGVLRGLVRKKRARKKGGGR